MDTRLILASVARHITLTNAEEEAFTTLLEPLHAPRKAVLHREGEIFAVSYFVNSGCLRSFLVDEEGVEQVLSFSPPGWWMADMYSLISGKPGMVTINALEDTDIWVLTKARQEQLFAAVPKFERYFRILVERSLVAYQQRVIDRMSLTAEERYLKFCHTYPTLIDALPQKQIASYIGVTPEFFSKMRTRLLRERD